MLVSLLLLASLIAGCPGTRIAVRHRSKAVSGVSAIRSYLPLGGFENGHLHDSAAEYAFNLAAFQDGKRFLIRIYSEIEPKYVDPIGDNELDKPHVNQCHVRSKNGTHFSVPTMQVDVQWAYGDAERIKTINKVIAYTIDCKDPGVGKFEIAPQLSNGVVLGKHIEVELMETERKGSLAACSQPLFTDMAGLEDWVDYHTRLGVEEFRMHVPRGDHIDALFSPDNRERRINETKLLNERSPESIGQKRLVQFDRTHVQWHEYDGAPTANYYSETPLFNACIYSYRYAYDYVMLYDCDEWFTLVRENATRHSFKTIPEFLARNLPRNVASLQMDSYAFPAQCAVTDNGDYSSRFTLRKPAIWENMQKLIVRPLAVACTAIHGIFDMTDQFKEKFLDSKDGTAAHKVATVPTSEAYIKHIRWFGPPNGTAISCKFGAESHSWDPEYTLVMQDDSSRRLLKGDSSASS